MTKQPRLIKRRTSRDGVFDHIAYATFEVLAHEVLAQCIQRTRGIYQRLNHYSHPPTSTSITGEFVNAIPQVRWDGWLIVVRLNEAGVGASLSVFASCHLR